MKIPGPGEIAFYFWISHVSVTVSLFQKESPPTPPPRNDTHQIFRAPCTPAFPCISQKPWKKKKKTQAHHHSNTLYIFQQYLSNPEREGGFCWREEVLVMVVVVVMVVVCMCVCVCVCVTKVLKSNSHYGKVGAVQAGGHRAAAASSLGAREAHQQKSRSSESGPAHSLQALCHWLMEMREFVFLCTSLFNTNEYGKKKKMTLFQHILTHITYRGTGHALKDGGKDWRGEKEEEWLAGKWGCRDNCKVPLLPNASVRIRYCASGCRWAWAGFCICTVYNVCEDRCVEGHPGAQEEAVWVKRGWGGESKGKRGNRGRMEDVGEEENSLESSQQQDVRTT